MVGTNRTGYFARGMEPSKKLYYVARKILALALQPKNMLLMELAHYVYKVNPKKIKNSLTK